MPREERGRALVVSVALVVLAPSLLLVEPSDSSALLEQPSELLIGFRHADPDASLLTAHGGQLLAWYPELRTALVRAADPLAFTSALLGNPSIAYIEPDAAVEALDVIRLPPLACPLADVSSSSCLPEEDPPPPPPPPPPASDPLRGQQWWLDRQKVPDWERGDRRVVIAVLDSGVDATHPDLAAHLWQDPLTGAHGYDTVDEDSTPHDAWGHGTHVAGIAAAVALNEEGIRGFAGDASLMAVRVMNEQGRGKISDVAEGIAWAAGKGANVLLMSFGWSGLPSGPSFTLQRAVDLAHASGAVLVAAAGNGGGVHAPALFPHAIATAGLELDGSALRAWGSSSDGPEVDLSAPAVDILSTVGSDNALNGCAGLLYCNMTGTSVAAAQVAGAAALLLSCRPSLTNDQVKSALQRTAHDVNHSAPDGSGASMVGWDRWTGWGYVNVTAAINTVGGCGSGAQPRDLAAPAGTSYLDPSQQETAWIADGLWHLSGERTTTANKAWRFGQAAGDFDTGGRVVGNLTASNVPLVGSSDARLSFALWEDTEATLLSDRLFLRLSWTSGNVTYTSDYYSNGRPQRTWGRYEVPIPTGAQGSAVTVTFLFDSMDALHNGHEGVVLDDLRIYQPASMVPYVNSQTLSGSLLVTGQCATHTVSVAPAVESLDIVLTDPTDADFDLRVSPPGEQGAGAWTCTDTALRQPPGSVYSGPRAAQEWVRTGGKPGDWTITVRSAAGSGSYTARVNQTFGPGFVPYGRDTTLGADRLALAFHRPGCTPGGNPACTGGVGSDTATAAASTTSGGGVPGEAGIGFRFLSERACDGQEQRADPTLRFDYSYDLSTSNAGTGIATATVVARPTTLEGTAAAIRSRANGLGDGSGSHATRQEVLDLVLGKFYEPSLGAFANASAAGLPGDAASASASVQLHELRMTFGDVTKPTYTSNLSRTDSAPAAANASFLGWLQSPAVLNVSALDPNNPDATKALTEPRSCVEKVVVDHLEGAGLPSDVLSPGPAQGNVSITYAADQRYDLRVRVLDFNGNQATAITPYHFGVDLHAPFTLLRFEPASATGDNGWYKRLAGAPDDGRPRLFLDCDDGPKASGCVERKLIEGASNSLFTPAEETGGRLVTDGEHSFQYASKDLATNQEPTRGPRAIKVDLALPEVVFGTSLPSGPDPSWFPGNLSVEPVCSDASPGSGCTSSSMDLGSGPEALAAFTVEGEGAHSVPWTAQDAAGNAASGTRGLHIDLQDPPGTTLTSPAGGFLTNALLLEVAWGAVADNGPAGLAHYEVHDNGQLATLAFGSSALLGLGEGSHCLKVRPVDKAGRAGPWSSEVCGGVDRTAPVLTFAAPLAGHLRRFDGTSVAVAWLGSKAAGVGNATARAEATDSGVAGLASITIRDTNVTDDPGVTCSTSPCDRAFAYPGYGKDPLLRKLEAVAVDHAGNQRVVPLDLDHVTVSGNSSSSSSAVVDNLPYTGPGFRRYELLRGTNPLALATVQTSTDPGKIQFVDTGLFSGTTYYYRVAYYYVNDLGLELSGLSHEAVAKTTASTGGGGGGYGGCGRCYTL